MAKSAFGAREVTYLGYRLTGEGISPGEAKLKAVSDFPAPLSGNLSVLPTIFDF